MLPQGPLITRELVLLGGGHSHVAVVKRFGMAPMPGVRLTLISCDSQTPYSGMLPGLIAGRYSREEAHIDLRRLCRFAGAQFYRGEVVGLDLQNKQVLMRDRPPVGFDLVSINTGSTPARASVPGAAEHALAVKPIDRFLQGLASMETAILSGVGPHRIVVVGGGAGGVELILSLQRRLQERLRSAGSSRALEWALVSDTAEVLPSHPPSVRRKFLRILRERGIVLHLGRPVTAVKPGRLVVEEEVLPFDAAVWVTHASAPEWIRDSGLASDAAGFVAVRPTLQSVSHPFVFAAGDAAAVLDHPRPKSGVFAVRQGRPLFENLRRASAGLPLRPYKPQKQFLSLIGTGEEYAVASRGPIALEGRWVWKWKDSIDRRWMAKYQDLPTMRARTLSKTEPSMRCGGCGAKVPGEILNRVLRRLGAASREDVLLGLESPDDAAVLAPTGSQEWVQTVDFFRAFINDPWIFGQVAANHSLSDIHAMGGRPRTAQVIVTLPHAGAHCLEEQLFQLMSGAMRVFNHHRVLLVGGHSAEGAELGMGFVVNGLLDGPALRKGGLKPGDHLLLAKPIGTGAILAADMRGKAKSGWVEEALASMLRSNGPAAEAASGVASAATDITGFGLAGHLMEMLRVSGLSARLSWPSIPLLPGFLETVEMGIASTLAPANAQFRQFISCPETAPPEGWWSALFDPQTAGGLLVGLPAERSASLLAQWHQQGYSEAALMGEVFSAGEAPAIELHGKPFNPD